MGSHQKGVDSSANTPIGSPSAYTPMAGSKRKIMSIHGRSDSITGENKHVVHHYLLLNIQPNLPLYPNVESKEEPNKKHTSTNGAVTTTAAVSSGAPPLPPLGRLNHSNLNSANDARTTQKLSTGDHITILFPLTNENFFFFLIWLLPMLNAIP